MSVKPGLPELIAGVICAAGAVVLTVVLDQPSPWTFVLFAVGTLAALLGVARLAHARAQRLRSMNDHPTDDRQGG
jgi:hypothetical protein